MLQSGICIPGNGKALVKLAGAGGNYLIAASQRQGNLAIFELNGKLRRLDVDPGDQFALLKLKTARFKTGT
jgi:hypothetical protein